MNKKISIIVPVYNVEKYIAKCLESLVDQDYDNYDVLVINDGSLFNEQAIIDEYVKKYPNILKSFVKDNGGYGSVLEYGFKTSDADYVLVCDSDDCLSSDCLSTLMNYRDKTDADIVIGSKYYVYEDSEDKDYTPSYSTRHGKIVDGQIYKKEDKDFELFFFCDSSPHAKLYRRDVVNNIEYPHKTSFTDTLLYYHALCEADSVVYCEKALSYYLVNRTGNTMTDIKPKVIDDHVRVYETIINNCKDDRDIYYYFLFDSFMHIYYMVDKIKGTREEKIEKYNNIYTILNQLISYKNVIMNKNDEYEKEEGNLIRRQKSSLLDSRKSKKTFELLYQYRLNNSLINKVKLYAYLGLR